jgi:hypothetical protein
VLAAEEAPRPKTGISYLRLLEAKHVARTRAALGRTGSGTFSRQKRKRTVYETFYGFAATPFTRSIAPQDLFRPEQFTACLARLQYLVQTRGFGLLTGEVPCRGLDGIVKNMERAGLKRRQEHPFLPVDTLVFRARKGWPGAVLKRAYYQRNQKEQN